MKILPSYLSLLCILTIAAGCTHDHEPDPVLTGQLYFHFHGNIDQTEIPGSDSIVTSSSGRKISLNTTLFYVSDISLVRADGSLYPIQNKVLLKTLPNETYFLGNIPVGNYKSVQFNVGFDSVTLSKIPISQDTVFSFPEMWFENSSLNQKYVYFNVQGKIDSTLSASGSDVQMVNFTYKIGTYANVQQIRLPDENFLISSNQVNYIHMVINYMKLFDGIDLTKQSNLSVQTISDNSAEIAKDIAHNIPAMFSYEF